MASYAQNLSLDDDGAVGRHKFQNIDTDDTIGRFPIVDFTDSESGAVFLSGASFYLANDDMPIFLPNRYDQEIQKESSETSKSALQWAAILSALMMLLGLPVAYMRPDYLGGLAFVIGATLWTAVGVLARR